MLVICSKCFKGKLVGSGKFVNQNMLVAGYYPRKARLTESSKV